MDGFLGSIGEKGLPAAIEPVIGKGDRKRGMRRGGNHAGLEFI
nr:hypothetical protein [Pseudomonas sp.]